MTLDNAHGTFGLVESVATVNLHDANIALLTLQSSQQDVLGAKGNLSFPEESYIPYPGSWSSE
jgi:hypothetical protein